MTLSSYHESVRNTISARLQSYNPKMKEVFPDASDDQTKIVQVLISEASGGKLNRSMLCFLGYDGYTSEKNPLLSDLACALEITHAAFLIQDDVMDNDRMRRGKDAVFVQLQKQYGSQLGNDEQLYKYLAVCIGDAGFHLANSISSTLPEPIRKTMNEVFFQTDIGQYDDLLYSQKTTLPEEAIIEQVYRNKTGKYTIGLPVITGMLLAGAPDEDVKTMKDIADILGLIYQITDDELNLIGDSQISGKPTGSDITENKKTIHMSRLSSIVKENGDTKLSAQLGKIDKTDDDIHVIIDAMHTYAVFNTLRDENAKRYERAMALLNTMHIHPIQKELLKEFAHNLLTRTA